MPPATSPLSQTILQNVREFVVQIRDPKSKVIRGTGFVISNDGLIVTCAHVIREVLGSHPRNFLTHTVDVYFPQAPIDAENLYQATIQWVPDTDDDIVLLHLIGTLPIGTDQIAVIGVAEQSSGNLFRGYGYAPTGQEHISTYVEGKIVGFAEYHFSGDGVIEFPHVQLQTDGVRKGVSGSPILDMQRNVVIGMIRGRSRDDHNKEIGWGVDLSILRKAPYSISFVSSLVYEDTLAPTPHTTNAPKSRLFPGWNIDNAPSAIDVWVGRNTFLEKISQDYLLQRKSVLAIVGFGGEGKSSLARRWLDEIMSRSSEQPPLEYSDDIPHPRIPAIIDAPDGVFWWSFYTDRNVDAFLEAALQFVSAKTVDPRQFASPLSKVAEIIEFVRSGRFIFVLDGLEVFQYPSGDQQGLIDSYDLTRFLEDFAQFEHDSFCLITSRLPVVSLVQFGGYGQYELEGLDLADSIALLEALGVHGPPAELESLVHDWDGHALTLTMIGTFLVRFYKGDIKERFQFNILTTEEADPYTGVRRVLHQYDARLSQPERNLLTLMSCFRTLIPLTALDWVFHISDSQSPLISTVNTLSSQEFSETIGNLASGRIIRFDAATSAYDIHALIREFYQERFRYLDQEQQQIVHRLISHYLKVSNEVSDDTPTLQQLLPLIEAVYHNCMGSDLSTALEIAWEKVSRRERYLLGVELGALSTALNMLENFFNEREFRKGIRLDLKQGSLIILNAFGYCLMGTGRLIDARDFFQQLIEAMPKSSMDNSMMLMYRNLAEILGYLGELEASRTAIEQLDIAAQHVEEILTEKIRNDKNPVLVSQLDEAHHHHMQAMTWLAWNDYLQGKVVSAQSYYQEAIRLARALDKGYTYPPFRGAVGYADFLMNVKQYDAAYTVIDAAFVMARSNHRSGTEALCHRILGDWLMNNPQPNPREANLHYERAVQLATNFGAMQYIIETLIARARGAIHEQRYREAGADLRRAIGFARDNFYRLYEAEAYNEAAHIHLATEHPEHALEAAQRALALSTRTSYFWGVQAAQQSIERVHQVIG